ncbi:MAG: hypothetical protein CMJ89_10590 [Planctomycetes bacterium]|nr:hypothetical protein [Planctomycetota bacterium]
MRIRQYASPRPHVVVDNCLSPDRLKAFLGHVRGLEPRMTVGMVRTRRGFDRSKIKENHVLFVDDTDEDPHAQAVLAELRAIAWSDPVLDFLEEADAPLFQILQYTEAPSIQISRYAEAGHYGFHKDVGNKTNLTVLFFACEEPQGFTGGNFVMEHGGKRKTIRFQANRLLIFPSSTLHRVTPVRACDGRFETVRFSMQIWPAISPGKSLGPRSMQILRREDQARHPLKPTFSVKQKDLSGSEIFYRSLFSGAVLPIDDIQLGAFGRLGGRLLSNLKFIAGSLYPGLKFTPRFQNVVDAATGSVETRIFLSHGPSGGAFEFGYRLLPQGKSYSPLRADLFAILRGGDETFEGSTKTSLSGSGARIEACLVRALKDCVAKVPGEHRALVARYGTVLSNAKPRTESGKTRRSRSGRCSPRAARSPSSNPG